MHKVIKQKNHPREITKPPTLYAFMRESHPLARPNSLATRVMSPQGAHEVFAYLAYYVQVLTVSRKKHTHVCVFSGKNVYIFE